MANKNDIISCEVVEVLGALSTNPKTSWSKMLRRCRWNGSSEIKLDIRDVAPADPERISRGITLTESEAIELWKLLTKYFKK